MGGERRDVVEQPAGLGVLDVEPGQRLELAPVVAELDDLGLDPDPVAVEVGDDVELVDVEAEVVEPLDALLDPPHLVGGELLLRGQLGPQLVVPLLRSAATISCACTSWSSEPPAWRSSSSAKTFSQRPGHVVLPHLPRQRRRAARRSRRRRGTPRTRRRCGGTARWTATRRPSRSRPGAGAPAARRARRPGRAGCRPTCRARTGAVGEREREVLGEQRARQLLAVRVVSAGDDAERHAPPAARGAGGRAAGGTRGTRSPPASP